MCRRFVDSSCQNTVVFVNLRQLSTHVCVPLQGKVCVPCEFSWDSVRFRKDEMIKNATMSDS